MRHFSLSFFLLVALLALSAVDAQFFRNLFRGIGNIFRPPPGGGRGFGGFGGFGGSRGRLDGTGGTRKPEATGKDNPFPDDCGRDDDNKGKLCFPDGLLCQQSE